jgi:ankyrin repeat protein
VRCLFQFYIYCSVMHRIKDYDITDHQQEILPYISTMSQLESKKKCDLQALQKLQALSGWHNLLSSNENERMIKVGRILVEGQMNDHQNIQTFALTQKGKLDELKVLLRDATEKSKRPVEDFIKVRDAVGGTILHMAYLYCQHEIAQYLVEIAPKCAALEYDIPQLVVVAFPDQSEEEQKLLGPYVGENILHMLISQRAYEQVKWLFNFLKTKVSSSHQLVDQILHAQTRGHIFQPATDMKNQLYLGEIPFLFAVCTNDVQLVLQILSVDPSQILQSDSHWNNALHMCVIHNLTEMYTLIEHLATAIIDHMNKADPGKGLTVTASLVDAPNSDGRTPFALAAYLGEVEMFQVLLKKRKNPIWRYGPMECSQIDLRGFDTSCSLEEMVKESHKSRPTDQPAAQPPLQRGKSIRIEVSPSERRNMRVAGAIDCICRQNRLEMLEIPEIEELITKKWDRFGRPMFMQFAILSLTVSVLNTVIIILTPSLNPDVQSLVSALYCLVWLLLFYRCVGSELRQVMNYGLDYWGFYGGIRGAAMLNNYCLTLENIFFTASILFHFFGWGDDSPGLKMCVGLSAFVSWIHTYYILMGLQTTGSFVVIVTAILLDDFPHFAKLYVILLLAFGSLYNMLVFNASDEVDRSANKFFGNLWDLFVYSVNGQSSDFVPSLDVDTEAKWLFQLIFAGYNLSCVLLLLNLLIAMMSTTYSSYVEKAKLVLMREKYNIMVNFERSLSDENRNRLQETYIVSTEGNKMMMEMQEIDPNWWYDTKFAPVENPVKVSGREDEFKKNLFIDI